MSSRHQICCVKRSELLNHDRRLRGIGGVNPDGSRWQITEQGAISGIEAGRWSFFVARLDAEVEVVVAASRYGIKYLKAADDRLHPETLLALPDCL